MSQIDGMVDFVSEDYSKYNLLIMKPKSSSSDIGLYNRAIERFNSINSENKLQKIDLLKTNIDEIKNISRGAQGEISREATEILNGPQVTNIEIFRTYIGKYLESRDDIYNPGEGGMTFLIRSLSPSPNGLPIELYVFTKTTVWGEYEQIQA